MFVASLLGLMISCDTNGQNSIQLAVEWELCLDSANINNPQQLLFINKIGTVEYSDSGITVKNADEVVLLLSASTDYKLEYPECSD